MSQAVPKMGWAEKNPQQAFEDIRHCSILTYFPKDFLEVLSTFGETRMYPANELILTEGAVNEEFFFLLFGSVEVLFGNDSTYKLSEVGEVFGEMSLIAKAPCTASVRTLEDACFLVFNHKEITDIVEQNKEEFGFVLYQVFSRILTKRLMEANQKAELVEKKGKELKRLSREMQIIAHERFQELWRKGNVTYDHLEKIYHNDICPLVDWLSGTELKVTAAELLPKITKIQQGVRPIFEMYSHDRGMRHKRVLLAETDKKVQRFTKTALVGAGVALTVVESREEAFKMLNQEHFDILLTSAKLIDVAELAHSVNPHMKLVLMTSESSLQHAHYFNSHPYLANIVSLHENARIFTLKNIFTTVGKLATGDLFGMEKYLNWGAEVKKHPVHSDFARIVGEMSNYMVAAGLRQPVIDRCHQVAKERLAGVAGDATGEKGEFQYACDGVMAAVAVQNSGGSFDRETVLTYLKKLHEGMDENEPGLHRIVQSADLTVFNLRSDVKTEIIALFNIDQQAEKNMKSHSFHLFYD